MSELNAEFGALDLTSAASLARNPLRRIDYPEAFAFLGLLMGILPPLAFFLRIALQSPGNDFAAFTLIALLVCATAATTGYFTGKTVGRVVKDLDRESWPFRYIQLPFIGLTWGIVAGFAGGAPLFLIGAIPGAVLGGAAGLVALPAFAILHKALRQEEGIEPSQLYPSAAGVAGTIAAVFLGYPF